MSRHSQKPESRELYLDNRSSYRVTVSKEGYDQILEIIRATAVCEECKQGYHTENPRVAGLLCLHCFLQKHSFTFIGLVDPALLGQQEQYFHPPEEEYLFLDQDGHAYLTDAGPGHTTDARKSIPVTLRYWHFPRPEQAERNGQVINIGDYDWSIYGDVKHDDVIVLQHGSQWYNNESLFVVRRNGPAIQINRRKPMHRALLAEARAELATRSPGNVHTSDVYQLVAQWVGEEMSAARAEQQGPEDREPSEPEPEE